jgi:hypothetical protein
MSTNLQPVKVNEQSANVANLQAVLSALGYALDPAEVSKQSAGETTAKAVRQFQKSVNLMPQPGYLVDTATATALDLALEKQRQQAPGGDLPRIVYGTVVRPDGQPARGLRVAAFDQDMRSRQPLGQATTDAAGRYRISYSAAQYQRSELGGPDLVVEAYGQSGEVLHTTDVLFNASAIANVSLTLEQVGAEADYDRIVRLLTPLLDGQGVTLDTLEENDKNQDVTFAAGETGVPRDELVDFAAARRLPPSTGLPAEFWFALLATKTIVPPTPPDNTAGIAGLVAGAIAAVPLTSVTAVQQGLNKALAANLIAKGLADQFKEWLRLYLELMVREATKDGSSSAAQNILNGSGVPEAKRNALLQAYLPGGSRDDILQRVRDTKQFNDQEVNAIGATLVLNDLTLGDGKLLLEFRKSITDPSAATMLARISQQDWVATITRTGSAPPDFVAGDTPEDQRNNYGTLLAKRAALAYPTAAFAGDLARAIDTKGKLAIPNAGQVLAFFDAHPDFELATTSIDGYMQQKARPEFFNAINKADFVSGLKATQRVFKVASNLAAANSLLQDDLHSAQKIYRMGETQFVQKYATKPGFNKTTAQETFQRAANTHAAVITVVGELRATQNANKVRGIANPVQALNDFPNLANLFGNADSCDCDECQSIFGAAAYLADLLHYLEGRLLIPPTGTVKDVLFSRRPDIGYIELTCQNSNTPLPYIDLACEIMEDRVAPWKLFDLPLALAADFVEGPPDANVKNAFANAAPPVTLSDAARVSAQDQFNSWVVHDVPQSYRVQQQAGSLAVSILRQTHGTEEELAANPEYVNGTAYTDLDQAVAPLALPFDLFTEEVRAYLGRASVQRANLMEVFRGPNAPNNPQDLDIAAEYLGIASGEQNLILQADPANQFLYWGKPWGDNDNPTTLASMAKVDVFLNRTGLQFADLQRMLTLSFVNPNGAIVIQNLDSSCDASQKRLQVLDFNALDRIHRFLRLWRKLGWNMWEVDLVIQHPALGNAKLDPPLLLRLYPFVQIKDKLTSLSVEQLCSFFGDINTASKFTTAYQKPAPSLYENLFLNKRLTNLVDPAFAISAVTAVNPPSLLTDSAHIAPILAATKVKQTDLSILEQLTKPGNGPAYLSDAQLSLKNLSFLYRHALLAKTLRIKVQDWQTLLYLSQQDAFKDPASTLAFLKLLDRIQGSGFSIDQLDYILTADLSAKSAAAEKTITPVLTALQKSLQAIAKANNPANLPATVSDLTIAIGTQLQTLGWDASSISSLVATFNDQVQLQRAFTSAPVGFDFPPNITNQMKIAYDKNAQTVGFTGVMTDAQQIILLNDPALIAVTGNPAYQRAINDIHDLPRLLMKFYSPFFRAQLATLPNMVQFGSLSSKDLAAKVNYDPILRELTFSGIMSTDDQDALKALSADASYQAAVQSLFNQPRAAVPPSPELWLAFATLLQPLAANLAANLLTAEQGLANYVQHKQSTDQVIQQLSAALGLTQAITGNLMTNFAIFPQPLPKHDLLPDFLDPGFVNASSAIASTAFPELYQGYYWLHRAALVLKAVAATDSDLLAVEGNTGTMGVLDLNLLPLEFTAVVGTNAAPGSSNLVLQSVPPNFPPNGTITLIGPQSVKLGYALAGTTLNVSSPIPQSVGAIAAGTTVTAIPVSGVPLLPLLNLAEFMQLHHSYSDDTVSLLAVVNRLITDATYTSALFGADVESLAGWTSSDVQALTAPNTISAVFPADYAKVDAWQRLKKAFSILQRLNASARSAMALANPVLVETDSASLKQMLRSKYDENTWLGISKSIQDDLRQRKRDSLVAYLLAQPMPADAPTGKWNDPEDLFAYYLIDVEMCSCQPTSRIVQASAAGQLFVQRCFMGLEPQVRVSVDADSAWSEWAWMKYYRVWEANRRVFAYPENYAEPELRKDKSDLFRNLENELQQNDVTKDNVETAFIHYLEGLDGIAQLEIAGTFFQESTQTLHVVGRTAGGDPRLYYYRQFIGGRRWTAWSKIDTDIKADYVVPLVANERLHLAWPEIRAEANPPSALPIPSSTDQSNLSTSVDPPAKQRSMYLAITEFKSGKWTPKKVSQDAIDLGSWTDDLSSPDGFHPERYIVIPVDLTWLPDFLFPPGKPRPKLPMGYEWILDGPFLLQACYVDPTYGTWALSRALYELAGCKGFPEPFLGTLRLRPEVTRFERDDVENSRNMETSDAALDVLTPRANTSLILHQEILGNTPDRFKIYYPHYLSFIDRFTFVVMLVLGLANRQAAVAATIERGVPVTLGTFLDWFYADKLRTFFVRPELYSRRYESALFYEDLEALIGEIIDLIAQKKYADAFKLVAKFFRGEYRFELLFTNFYHPLTCLFAKTLYQKGVDGLMARETQFADRKLDFKGQYEPTSIVDMHYPQEIVDFAPNGSYSLYNWELFFHAPLMVAERLSQNQKFEDAMRWFHYIFDPTGSHDVDPVTGNPAPSPQKYWITNPFYLRQQTGPNGYLAQRLENLMNLLASDPTNPSTNPMVRALQQQVDDWRKNPFDPHLVAQYRTVAYQKLTVMKYIDNLIAWGDQLFEMDTLESVNEATQLYVIAAEIMGQAPRKIPPPAKPVPQTFNELDLKLDAFSNALVDFENLIPPMSSSGGGGAPAPPVPSLLYFCIPQNDKLASYWATVEDRLYKIRHCLNIEGVFHPPALFAPPIDPLALIKAAAAGLDLSTALSDLDAPLPFYRFTTMIQKANEFTNDVKALGTALLAALEKRDAEAIALLRQSQEIALLQAVRDVKQKQIDDAQLVIDGLQKNKEMVTIRRDYYASREFMNAGENTAMALSIASTLLDAGIAVGYILAGGLKLIPEFVAGAAGFGGSPTVTVQEGGDNIGNAADDAVKTMSAIATALDKGASIASTAAGYQRRMDDWQNQLNLANKELEQLDKQIASAQKKYDIAQNELANQDLQISNSQAVDQFMHSKYTNQDLYDWMIGQISQTYFQAYQLAFDLAKRAERCYRYEIGVDDSSYIQFGYWDSLKKGLQAGERLQLDLRRLESAYLDQNRREFECTKHVSLAMANPPALLALKDQGICTFGVPEELFDLDYAGHYFRRIKSVSVSIPCVAGPRTTVNATLRLVKNMVRINNSLTGDDPQNPYVHNHDDSGVYTDDDRFRESHVRVNAIATSSGQNDSGMFELNFRDERYLPFEGAGAVSVWQLELTQNSELRQFSYDTISDVILHVKYTSREDTGPFRDNAVKHLTDDVLSQISSELPLRRLFDLMHEFPTEWYAFLHPPAGSPETLQFSLRRQSFPYVGPDKHIQLEAISLFVRTKPAIATLAAQLDPTTNGANVYKIPFPGADKNGFYNAGQDGLGFLLDETQPCLLQLGTQQGLFNTLADGDILDCYMVVEYTLQ